MSSRFSTLSAFIVALFCASSVNAQFSSEAIAVSSIAESMYQLAVSFDVADPPYGPLADAVPLMKSAVASLYSSPPVLTDQEVDVTITNNLVSTVVRLLEVLVQKQSDFVEAFIDGIVSDAMRTMHSNAVGVAFKIVSAVSTNCAKVSSLSSGLEAYASAFSGFDSAYGFTEKVSFPPVPVCTASSSPAPSSEASSPEATSAASSPGATSAASSPGATSVASSAPAPLETDPSSPVTSSVVPSSSASAPPPSETLSVSSSASAPAPSSASSAVSSSVCYAPAPFRRRRKRDTPSNFDIQASSLAAIESDFAGKVSSWNLEAGLPAAYNNIQASFSNVFNAVMSLHTIVGSITDADVDVEAVNNVVAQTVSVLNALTQKAADFDTLGATELVQHDLTSVQGPAVEIGFSIVAAIKSDCAKVTSLAAALSSYQAAFNSVDAAYSLATSAFPDVPACNPHPDSSIIVPCGASTSATPSGAASSSSAPVIPSSAASGIRNTTSDGTAVTTHVTESSTTVTKVQTVYTTVCPASTTFTANGNTYTGTPGQTITVGPNKSAAAPPPVAPSNPAAAPPVANGAATRASSLLLAAFGAVVFLV